MISIPAPGDYSVKHLLDAMDIQSEPFFIPLKPDFDALEKECFENVKQKIAKEGGTKIIGWQIWQHPYMIEAELHGVWLSPHGDFLDITPKGRPIDRILFVQDDNRKLNAKQVDNKRLNTTTNKLVDDFIVLAEAGFALANKGDRAFQTGEVTFQGNDAHNWKAINRLMIEVDKMIVNGLTRNSPCFCSSGIKYKHCHGKDLIFKLR